MNQRAAGDTAIESPYGPIAPVKDLTTGLLLLQLPKGFRYRSFGWTGDLMDDGVKTPSLHDGMAVIVERGHRLTLVRNHEAAGGAPFTTDTAITYKTDGAGGTTNIVFNTDTGRWEKAWSSLAGTIRNCAGGLTPWKTWITCEETGDAGHGYCFEVGVKAGDPTPLVAMGRFSHEALAFDFDTGYAYETEDAGDCGFYKFVPNHKRQLARGGKLYMMRVKGQPNAALGGAFPIGTTWNVDWVPVADPDAATQSTYAQGAALGGAKFRRLEGCWTSEDNKIYFLSTDGGQVREGQVFVYDPCAEVLKLIYDSPSAAECENPDNIVVTPRGALLLCEDNSGPTTNDAERLLGLTKKGKLFTFAKNNIDFSAATGYAPPAGKTVALVNHKQNEWAGACFSPCGEWLFVNIQTPGITFAITGCWDEGPF
jgi:secreted PhoX family phosphatase